jgi:hypothetical protein
MKINMIKIINLSLLFISFTFTLNSCSKDVKSPTETEQQPSLNVSPFDGSTGVQLNAPVTLTFNKPVIKGIVESDFHLISARDMADSMSMGHPMMNHDDMMMAMSDSTVMHHLDRYHSTHGGFTWNSDSTICTFVADSMLTRDTQYMIHLGDGMVRMMKEHMGDMNTMNGMGTGQLGDNIMLHFTTID